MKESCKVGKLKKLISNPIVVLNNCSYLTLFINTIFVTKKCVAFYDIKRVRDFDFFSCNKQIYFKPCNNLLKILISITPL